MTAYLTVGRTLADAKEILSRQNRKFSVTYTKAGRSRFQTDDNEFRIVRETTADDGEFLLVAAAKQKSTCD